MNKNNDTTAVVGAETDVAPLGRDAPKPAHELTASEDVDSVDWAAVERSPAFRELLACRKTLVQRNANPQMIAERALLALHGALR